ncbi:hypothetical protein GCM10023172_30580 [Hymenobacter ginsengisoli]|uniref:Polyketide cyclase / dehydrase and lipid transport n=1 Tax=Hymenobacter ginsengisoli TaxID=1051626 RepID=A0ABP8QL27_9BACT|nr:MULTISPECIES: hypothetical protein [unclassified Hymenobacter]MBO2033329.1 hypothetical protein [Hymenobacter sp. BT559]
MRQNPFSHCLPPASSATALGGVPARTTIEYVLDIACPIAKLRDFMTDTQQWLPWTMPTLESVQPLPFGQWLLRTSRKLLKLRLCPVTSPDELLYELVVPGRGGCQAQVRIGATLRGCQLSLTLRKHQQLPLPAFTTTARHALSGLHTLKLVLEQD